MDADGEIKRLFFAFEVDAPWPETYPEGRLLRQSDRHMTIVFLGNVPYKKVLNILTDIPIPPTKVGTSGYFDKILFLPTHHPRVVAWHANLYAPVNEYVKTLRQWIKNNGFILDKHETFLPHITIARSPFSFTPWRKHFKKLPITITSLQLFESAGDMRYIPLWTHKIPSPFQELEHTADIAYLIRGETLQHLFENAMTALAFKFPDLLDYYKEPFSGTCIEDVILSLNNLVTAADADIGAPFKAICFHGEIQHESDHTLSWEMIVDV